MSRREIIIAVTFLLIGIFATDFLGQARISTSKQATQSQEKITENAAINIVKNLPEVKGFLNRIEKANQKAFFTAYKVKNVWNVQVAQDATATYPMTTTFNWYTIEIDTGNIKCSFSTYDQYGKYLKDNNDYPCDEQATPIST